jgi:hypothetical protein
MYQWLDTKIQSELHFFDTRYVQSRPGSMLHMCMAGWTVFYGLLPNKYGYNDARRKAQDMFNVMYGRVDDILPGLLPNKK